LLAIIALALVWSTQAVPHLSSADEAQQQAKQEANDDEGIGDFALYARIHDRVADGQSYYASAVEEQRANNYPTQPFMTVRLPTLAMMHKLIGAPAVGYLAVGLLIAGIGVFLPSMQDRASLVERVGAAVLMLLGGFGAFAQQAPFIHELLAGSFLSLGLVLYRTNRWWPTLLCAACALALRELALPFVILWMGLALVNGRWKEVRALVVLVALFAAGLYWHAQGVAAHALPGDMTSPGWDAFTGPALPLLALARVTGLVLLPLWLAAPLAVLPLVGWLGSGGRKGLFASLWFAGFFLAMALFARAENFYWALLILPLYAAGLAFAPRAIADLVKALTKPLERQT